MSFQVCQVTFLSSWRPRSAGHRAIGSCPAISVLDGHRCTFCQLPVEVFILMRVAAWPTSHACASRIEGGIGYLCHLVNDRQFIHPQTITTLKDDPQCTCPHPISWPCNNSIASIGFHSTSTINSERCFPESNMNDLCQTFKVVVWCRSLTT